jgi:hypothetical protein
MGRGGQAPCISAIEKGYFSAVRHDMINEVEKFEYTRFEYKVVATLL